MNYADKTDLLFYADERGTLCPVRTAADWEKRRRHILANLQTVMGGLPPDARKVPLDIEVLGEETTGTGVVRRKISFAVEPRDRVPAYLLLPPSRSGRLPAMLCLHPTTELGKAEVAGVSGRPSRQYALELAERGYVTLAPDYPLSTHLPTFCPDYRIDPYALGYASTTMKGIWNHLRAVDLLLTLREVDAERIGVIGHSLGAYNAVFAAAFDPRLTVIVASAGITSFFRYQGGNLAGWSHRGHMPRIATAYGNDPARMPFDFTEALAALAPRPLFINAPLRDTCIDVCGARECLAAATPVYGLFGACDRLVATYPDTEHDFPDDVRAAAYRFVDRALLQAHDGR